MRKNSGCLSPEYTSRQDDLATSYHKLILCKHHILLTVIFQCKSKYLLSLSWSFLKLYMNLLNSAAH